MNLSKNNALALLLDLSQDIEEYADTTVRNIIERKEYTLTYPPNGGLTEQEVQALKNLDNNEVLKNALRKVIADNTAGVIFNLLNLLDGTSSPKTMYSEWTNVKLVDEEEDPGKESFEDTLHDSFFETYWEWRKHRGEKSWKLDTLED